MRDAFPQPSAAVPEDAREVFALRGELERWLAARKIKQWNPGEVALDEIADQISGGEWYVARREGELVGALRLLWADPRIWGQQNTFAAYVHGLMVPRRHAGHGLGAALLNWAEGQARARTAPYLRLDCVASNTRLKEYYKSLGFTEVGQLEGDGSWYSAVLLEKRLEGPLPQGRIHATAGGG